MIETRPGVGGRIKALRNDLGLSQADFGAKIGVSRSVINNLERGAVKPSGPVIMALCTQFGTNQKWLIGDDGHMYDNEQDELVTKIDILLSEEDETVRGLFQGLAKLQRDDWIIVKNMIDSLNERSAKITAP